MRSGGRSSTQMRPIRLTPNYTKHSAGSCLVELGDTTVLCSVNVENNVPIWLRNSKPAKGWMTAEYCMLPSSTHQRSKRERGHTSGRSQEIQRLIGRSLRGVLDLQKCPDMTFVLDCDVIQADAGTRVASIIGGWVALKIAIDKLHREGKLRQNPLTDNVAAISVGLKNDQVLVDLDYQEDSSADVDFNLVMTQSGKILEIQGTAEGSDGFSQAMVNEFISSASETMSVIYDLQQVAAEGQIAEG